MLPSLKSKGRKHSKNLYASIQIFCEKGSFVLFFVSPFPRCRERIQDRVELFSKTLEYLSCDISTSKPKRETKCNRDSRDKTDEEGIDDKFVYYFYVIEHDHERKKHDDDFCSHRDNLARFLFGKFECLVDDIMDRVGKTNSKESDKDSHEETWEIGK